MNEISMREWYEGAKDKGAVAIDSYKSKPDGFTEYSRFTKTHIGVSVKYPPGTTTKTVNDDMKKVPDLTRGFTTVEVTYNYGDDSVTVFIHGRKASDLDPGLKKLKPSN